MPVAGDYDIDLQLLGATGKFVGRWSLRSARMGWWGGHGDIVFPNRDNVIPTTDGLDNLRRLVKLSAGPHAITVEVEQTGAATRAGASCLGHSRDEGASFAASRQAAARSSKVAVVFAWSRNRPLFGLPGDQDRLIAAVAPVNPNTIVVLNTGQAVAMPWLKDVRAVLEMWYTGDEGGWAAANLLTGQANPGGRLPITWPVHLEDYAAMDPRYPERASRGVDGRTQYTEGMHVGYRWFDHKGIAPLFPFGHGMSYSTFVYSDLRLDFSADGGVTVTCRVRNSSQRDGDAVIQAYLGAPTPAPAGADFAVRALAAFERVRVEAGGMRQVQLQIAPQRLRYWSLTDHAWHNAARGGRKSLRRRFVARPAAFGAAPAAGRRLGRTLAGIMPAGWPRNIAR